MLMKSLKTAFVTIGLLISCHAYADSTDSLLRQANDPVAGNPKGNVTVVEFFDYQCSHCVNMAPVMEAIIKANPNVRVVFKEYPIRGPQSNLASRAALAANKQSKYYTLNHALMTTNQALNENNILEIAKEAGLNTAKLKKDMNSDAVKKQIEANYALASELNITGTPAFFIGKTSAKKTYDVNFVLGEMSQTELQDAINKAGN